MNNNHWFGGNDLPSQLSIATRIANHMPLLVKALRLPHKRSSLVVHLHVQHPYLQTNPTSPPLPRSTYRYDQSKPQLLKGEIWLNRFHSRNIDNFERPSLYLRLMGRVAKISTFITTKLKLPVTILESTMFLWIRCSTICMFAPITNMKWLWMFTSHYC